MSGEDHVTRVHRALGAPRRAEILRLLQESGRSLAIQDIVEATSLHPNTVRNHLERLTQAGLVLQLTEQRTAPGRPRSLFTATAGATEPASDGSDDAGYRDLAGILASSLSQTGNPAAQAVRAGQRWLQTLASHDWPARPAPSAIAISDLVLLLDEMDLLPVLADDASGVAIQLSPAPDSGSDDLLVLLSVHVGMVRRALERLDSPVEVSSVEAVNSKQPDAFVIGLVTSTDRRDSSQITLPVVSRPSTNPTAHRAQRRPA